MNKTKLTRSLVAACAIVAITGVMYGCGGSGTPATDMADEMDDSAAIAMAQSGAATAAMEADTAADAAEAAVMAQDDNRAAAPESYAMAQAAAKFARDAANAAQQASDRAAATDDITTAQMYLATAATAQSAAESARNDAVMYAGMVADAQQAIDDENQRVMDVASARAAAMQSYMDADADATKAETAAAAAEMAAPGSPGAMAANQAAMAARTAANAAKMAHDAIMDGMTKAEADAQAAMAATQAGNAKEAYETAKMENDAIQTAAATGDEQQRQRDVAAATSAAGDAAMAASEAATAARMAATSARMAADAAKAAYEMAMRARTDSTNARMHYMAADAAATAAENAAMAAEMAATAAGAAHMGIDAGGSTADARAAQMTAETEQGEAETQRDMAMAAYDSDDEGAMGAMQLAAMAADAAGTHVIGLLIAANGQNITEPIIDNSATPEDESMTVEQLRAAAAGRAAMAVTTAAAAADNGEAGTTATATWPGDTLDDLDTTDVVDPAPGVLSIDVIPENTGGALTFRTAAVADDPETTDTDESAPQTAGNIAGLGDFSGFDISEGTRHVIVFTDKVKGEDQVLAVTPINAKHHVDHPVDDTTLALTVTDLGTMTGTGYTGVTAYEGEVNEETDPDTAFMGSLTCPTDGDCSVELNANGTFTVTGYQFTGSRPARAEVTPAAATDNMNYLVFGVWLDEDGDGTDPADDPQFGAFAAGPSTAEVAATVTGTATYEGSATGLYTAGSNVDYFQGDAELTADFGTDAAQGNITGMIDNIVAGGYAMDDVIYLNDNAGPTDNIASDGTFSGDARMGESTTVDAVTTYTHNGSWSGRFYNGTANDPETTEDESLVAPGSVAGTFGVTGTTGTGDGAMTRSYVGAFGAHKN